MTSYKHRRVDDRQLVLKTLMDLSQGRPRNSPKVRDKKIDPPTALVAAEAQVQTPRSSWELGLGTQILEMIMQYLDVVSHTCLASTCSSLKDIGKLPLAWFPSVLLAAAPASKGTLVSVRIMQAAVGVPFLTSCLEDADADADADAGIIDDAGSGDRRRSSTFYNKKEAFLASGMCRTLEQMEPESLHVLDTQDSFVGHLLQLPLKFNRLRALSLRAYGFSLGDRLFSLLGSCGVLNEVELDFEMFRTTLASRPLLRLNRGSGTLRSLTLKNAAARDLLPHLSGVSLSGLRSLRMERYSISEMQVQKQFQYMSNSLTELCLVDGPPRGSTSMSGGHFYGDLKLFACLTQLRVFKFAVDSGVTVRQLADFIGGGSLSKLERLGLECRNCMEKKTVAPAVQRADWCALVTAIVALPQLTHLALSGHNSAHTDMAGFHDASSLHAIEPIDDLIGLRYSTKLVDLRLEHLALSDARLLTALVGVAHDQGRRRTDQLDADAVADTLVPALLHPDHIHLDMDAQCLSHCDSEKLDSVVYQADCTAQSLSFFPALRTLSLVGSLSLTDRVATPLLLHCPNLRRLMVSSKVDLTFLSAVRLRKTVSLETSNSTTWFTSDF